MLTLLKVMLMTVFLFEVCRVIVIQPFDGNNTRSVVVLHNASIHYVNAVCSLISAAGALIKFLPPYSPDLNLTKEAFDQK